jgi:hypothetical protein
MNDALLLKFVHNSSGMHEGLLAGVIGLTSCLASSQEGVTALPMAWCSNRNVRNGCTKRSVCLEKL